jgi:hypothetical protein
MAMTDLQRSHAELRAAARQNRTIAPMGPIGRRVHPLGRFGRHGGYGPIPREARPEAMRGDSGGEVPAPAPNPFRWPGVAVHALYCIVIIVHTEEVNWEVDLHDDFVPEYRDLQDEVQDELLALVELLERFGPRLGRPRADTLNGSRHPNMKELRFAAVGGVWRVAFAFDPKRKAILLVAGDKSGGSEKRFYRRLIEIADERFDAHLAKIENRNEKKRRQRP